MGRRKKEFVEEKPVAMVENAMNEPVEEEIKDTVEPQTENVVVDVPTVEVPVAEEVKEAEITESPKAENEPVFKKIQCSASLVNVRDNPNGDVLFTVRNLSRIRVENEVEVDGVKWTKISGYVMSELVKDL